MAKPDSRQPNRRLCHIKVREIAIFLPSIHGLVSALAGFDICEDRRKIDGEQTPRTHSSLIGTDQLPSTKLIHSSDFNEAKLLRILPDFFKTACVC